jgi:hypothetical protein
MFLFKWFGISAGGAFGGGEASFNAWESFSFIDIVLFITILVAIGGALMTANAQSVNTPVAISAITTGLAIISLLLILFRIISPPDFGAGDFGLDDAIDTSRKIGVFLGLIATAGIAYGGWKAMEEEGTSFQHQADRVQNRGGGDPPPPPPPPPADTGGSTPPPAG